MESARIGLFEEYTELREHVYPRLLKRAGHEVVLSADSAADAWVKLNEFSGVMDVALVDFDPGPHRPNEHQTETVVELLREKFGETVKIVTVNTNGETPDEADEHIEKIDIPQAFISYINEL